MQMPLPPQFITLCSHYHDCCGTCYWSYVCYVTNKRKLSKILCCMCTRTSTVSCADDEDALQRLFKWHLKQLMSQILACTSNLLGILVYTDGWSLPRTALCSVLDAQTGTMALTDTLCIKSLWRHCHASILCHLWLLLDCDSCSRLSLTLHRR